jgi:hypothetical protein
LSFAVRISSENSLPKKRQIFCFFVSGNTENLRQFKVSTFSRIGQKKVLKALVNITRKKSKNCQIVTGSKKKLRLLRTGPVDNSSYIQVVQDRWDVVISEKMCILKYVTEGENK